MYNDYSINEILFHWQSQSTMSDNSPTGQRYIHRKDRGSKVVICVREFKNDAAGAASYSLLGLCDFVKYEGSEQAEEYNVEVGESDTSQVFKEDE